MADLTNFATDPTLDAMDRAAENASANRPKKASPMGAASIGEQCERKVWLNFRIAGVEQFNAETLYRFEDGFNVEAVIANRLAAAGISIRTIDLQTGYQFGVSAVDGHLKGRIDGLIDNLIQAPAVTHVWECKATGDKSLALLVKAKAEHGEKAALKAWNDVYHAQAQIYMHLLGLTRHYLTASSPGARTTVSVRTNADPIFAQSILEKAERIKNAQELPFGISDDAMFFKCKMCSHNDLCHQNKVADVNCRTCAHSTPVANGEWSCSIYKKNVPEHFQVVGCEKHLFTPSLIRFAKPIDASVDDNWIKYERADGRVFVNGQGNGMHTSKELKLCDVSLIGDAGIDAIKQIFDAEIVG